MGNDLEEKLLQRTGIRAVVKEGDFGVLVEGPVGTEEERRTAIQAIREIAPTDEIIDRLHVVADPETNIDPNGEVLLTTVGRGGMDDKWSHEEVRSNLGDDAIYDAVQHVLREDETTSGAPIHVAVHDGHVRLSGTSVSQEVADRALTLARQVPGIADVQGDLHGHVA